MKKILEKTDFEYNLSKYDIDSIFTVHEDIRKNNVFNLNETTYFNIPEKLLKYVILDHPLHWSVISYRIYRTTRLVWFLMKLNKVSLTRAFIRVPPATKVYYVDSENIEMLLRNIKTQIDTDNK